MCLGTPVSLCVRGPSVHLCVRACVCVGGLCRTVRLSPEGDQVQHGPPETGTRLTHLRLAKCTVFEAESAFQVEINQFGTQRQKQESYMRNLDFF